MTPVGIVMTTRGRERVNVHALSGHIPDLEPNWRQEICPVAKGLKKCFIKVQNKTFADLESNMVHPV